MRLPRPILITLFICLGVAVISSIIAPFIPVLNSIILGLFVGILLGNSVPKISNYKTSISKISSRSLEFSILFLAFSIDYKQLGETGGMSVLLIMFMIAMLLLITSFLHKRFRCNESTAWLIGFGTAICGSSAIAALAPSFDQDKNDTGIAIAVVNFLGTIGMLLLPAFLALFELTDQQIGALIGSSLHSVGNVAGAAYAMGNEVGETAIAVKLARVAMLSPALLIFNTIHYKGPKRSLRQLIKLPWYLVGFILVSLVNSYVLIDTQVVAFFNETGKFLLTMAMVAIGLNMSFTALIKTGKKGLLFGTVLFVIQLLLVAFLGWILL